jgi:hypothetical protein
MKAGTRGLVVGIVVTWAIIFLVNRFVLGPALERATAL